MSMTAAIADLPDRFSPSRAARLMLWSIAGFTAFVVAWAALTRIDEIARAPGRVVPSSQLQTVSNLEGGIVSQILVRSGQKVKAGDVLVRLDRTQSAAEVGRGEVGGVALAAKIVRLEAEAAGRTPVFPARLFSGPDHGDIVAAERTVHQARMADLAAQTGTAAARLDAANRMAAQARVALTTAGAAETSARQELAMIAPLVAKGIEPQIEQLRAQGRVDAAAGQAAAAREAARQAQASVAEAASQLRASREAFRTRAAEELAAARAQLAEQQRVMPALTDRLARTEVRAPMSGTVNRVMPTTVGGAVRPGEPLVEIVPAAGDLVIEARVRPVDAGFVHQGQRALVKLTAYDYSLFGGLEGQVERISPDAIVDERTGESWYAVRVRADTTALKTKDGQQLRVGPGMTAEVDLIGHRRSILSYILTPVTRLQDNAFRER